MTALTRVEVGTDAWEAYAAREDARESAVRASREDLADSARYLLPVLKRYCDNGWPGLSERDRQDATNALWDMETALLHLTGRK